MMKYLKLALFSCMLFAVADAFALFGRHRHGNCGDCNTCEAKCDDACDNVCEPKRPCCVRTVTYRVPAKKVCEDIKVCRYECPPNADVIGTEEDGKILGKNGEEIGSAPVAASGYFSKGNTRSSKRMMRRSY